VTIISLQQAGKERGLVARRGFRWRPAARVDGLEPSLSPLGFGPAPVAAMAWPPKPPIRPAAGPESRFIGTTCVRLRPWAESQGGAFPAPMDRGPAERIPFQR